MCIIGFVGETRLSCPGQLAPICHQGQACNERRGSNGWRVCPSQRANLSFLKQESQSLGWVPPPALDWVGWRGVATSAKKGAGEEGSQCCPPAGPVSPGNTQAGRGASRAAPGGFSWRVTAAPDAAWYPWGSRQSLENLSASWWWTRSMDSRELAMVDRAVQGPPARPGLVAGNWRRIPGEERLLCIWVTRGPALPPHEDGGCHAEQSPAQLKQGLSLAASR